MGTFFRFNKDSQSKPAKYVYYGQENDYENDYLSSKQSNQLNQLDIDISIL